MDERVIDDVLDACSRAMARVSTVLSVSM
jgi:hypothetical protein